MGQPVGGHTDSSQAESFQFTDLVDQGGNDRHFHICWLFHPGGFILTTKPNEGRKARLMVLTIEPLFVPSF
jgi:hypothetical protein